MARIRLTLSEVRPGALPLVCMACGQTAVTHVSRSFSWRPAWMSTAFRVGVYGLLPVLLLIGLSGFFCMPLALAVIIAFLLVIATAALIITVFVTSRRVTVDGPMCDRHRYYWGWRGFWMTAPLLVLTIAVVAQGILMLGQVLPIERYGVLLFATIVLLVGWAATAAILHRTSIRAAEITSDSITLTGLSPEFVEAVRGPEPTGQTDWDVYDPYPRRVG
jgi:hypothetical protein